MGRLKGNKAYHEGTRLLGKRLSRERFIADLGQRIQTQRGGHRAGGRTQEPMCRGAAEQQLRSGQHRTGVRLSSRDGAVPAAAVFCGPGLHETRSQNVCGDAGAARRESRRGAADRRCAQQHQHGRIARAWPLTPSKTQPPYAPRSSILQCSEPAVCCRDGVGDSQAGQA